MNLIVEQICSLEAEIKIKELQKAILMDKLDMKPGDRHCCSIGYIDYSYEKPVVHVSNMIDIQITRTHHLNGVISYAN